MADITLWKPEANTVLHQALGKLNEEAGELQQIVARCLIQGADACDPRTGAPNRERLAEEIADVFAAARWLREVGGLKRLTDREDKKYAGFRQCERMLIDDRLVLDETIRDRVLDLFEHHTAIPREVLQDGIHEVMTEHLGISELEVTIVEQALREDFQLDIDIDIGATSHRTSIAHVVQTIEQNLRRKAAPAA